LLLVAAVIAEMWPLTIGWNSPFPTSTFYPRTPLIDAVLRHHRPGFDRVAGIGGVLFPNTNAMFGIEDARLHDPMEPLPFVRLIGGVISHDYYKKWLDDSTPLLDRLNVRWLMTEPGHELKDTSRYVLRYDGADGRLYENLHVLPRFFAADANVRILSANGDAYTLEVAASKPAVVMSSVGWSKWWKLSFRSPSSAFGRAANRLLAMKGDPFLSFAVPAGRTIVRIRYVPISFYIAALISLLTAVVLVCFMIRARVQRHMDLRRRALRDGDRLRPALESGGP
jgi:hypothetical protein